MSVRFGRFYEQYHGHPLEDLKIIHETLRRQGKHIVWLCGDSSLDNKFWNLDCVEDACNGYENIIVPAKSVCDVAHEINKVLCDSQYACINCALEESTVSRRMENGLYPQDLFVQQHLSNNDILIVSLGGNDTVLQPSVDIVCSIAALYLTPQWLLRNGWCIGKGPLRKVFEEGMQKYVDQLTAYTSPRLVMPCAIYFPCVLGNGWCDRVLSLLNYSAGGNPSQLQEIIRLGYSEFICNLRAPESSRLIPIPLYELLDPYDTLDYKSRVEPSAQGGKKMATRFVEIVKSL